MTDIRIIVVDVLINVGKAAKCVVDEKIGVKQEEAAWKYHKCVLKPENAVQSCWKWIFIRRNDKWLCTIYRGIKHELTGDMNQK